MTKHGITVADVRAAANSGRTIALVKGSVVTPAARDLAKQLGVALVRDAGSREPDHRFAQKVRLPTPGSRSLRSAQITAASR